MSLHEWRKKYIINVVEFTGDPLDEITPEDSKLLDEFDEFVKFYELDILVDRVKFQSMVHNGTGTLKCYLDGFDNHRFLFFVHKDDPSPHWRMTTLYTENYRDYCLKDVKAMWPTTKKMMESFWG